MDPVQLSLRPHFDHPGLGNDAGPRRRRRDATGALASPALLGTGRPGESVSKAQSAAMDIFPFYLCPDSPSNFYLASAVLFPPESSLDEFVNYKTHYYSSHRVFFVLFALSSPVDSSIPC